MVEKLHQRLSRFTTPLIEMFGMSPKVAVTVVLLAMAIITYAFYWFFHTAPPDTLVITAGAPGSIFQSNAVAYQVLLARKGITVKILDSQGSLENLQRLEDPSVQVDVGIVQGGVTNVPDRLKIVSLGSINYEPLLVFYRSPAPITLLSGFNGKRLAIGTAGSGSRAIALDLLKLNGIASNGPTALLDLEGEAAANALLKGEVDAAFLTGDSTPPPVMHAMLVAPGIHLFDFTQADAYSRKIKYLNKLQLPEGIIDFGKNIPAHDVNLVGPTVELLVRPTLHPALSDLLIEAAQATNSAASVFKRRNEFPAPIPHDYPISEDASRYYKSGKNFFYSALPFWLASLVSRVVVSFVPLLVIIPSLRLIPASLKWRMQLRINRWYRELLALERGIPHHTKPGERQKLLSRLIHIEEEVNKMKVPASFADQFYGLRGHIQFVRDRIAPPDITAK